MVHYHLMYSFTSLFMRGNCTIMGYYHIGSYMCKTIMQAAAYYNTGVTCKRLGCIIAIGHIGVPLPHGLH